MGTTFRSPLARSFVAASSQYLQCSSSPIAVCPFSMACWFKSNSSTLDQTLMSIQRATSFQRGYALMAAGATAGDPVRLRGNNGSDQNCDSISGYVVGQWTHAAATITASVSRCFINGKIDSGGGSSSGDVANVTNRTIVGRQIASAATRDPMDGQVVWPTIWNVELTNAEVALLATGVNPLTIRPSAIVAFWDFSGGVVEYNTQASFPLTDTNGSTISLGPDFLRKQTRRIIFVPSVAGGGGNRRRRVLMQGCR